MANRKIHFVLTQPGGGGLAPALYECPAGAVDCTQGIAQLTALLDAGWDIQQIEQMGNASGIGFYMLMFYLVNNTPAHAPPAASVAPPAGP